MASNWDRLDLSLRESVQENVELYERVRPALKLVTREVLLTLRTMLKGTEVTPLVVTGRTKTVESFREKISRTEEPLEPGGPPVLKFPDPLVQFHVLLHGFAQAQVQTVPVARHGSSLRRTADTSPQAGPRLFRGRRHRDVCSAACRGPACAGRLGAQGRLSTWLICGGGL